MPRNFIAQLLSRILRDHSKAHALDTAKTMSARRSSRGSVPRRWRSGSEWRRAS